MLLNHQDSSNNITARFERVDLTLRVNITIQESFSITLDMEYKRRL